MCHALGYRAGARGCGSVREGRRIPGMERRMPWTSHSTTAELLDVLKERESGELHRLAMRGEHVDRIDEILQGEPVLHGEDALVDHLRCKVGEDVNPEDPVALRLGDDLHEAASVVDYDGLRHALQEYRVACAADPPAFVRLRIGRPDGGHRRIRENGVGHRAV